MNKDADYSRIVEHPWAGHFGTPRNRPLVAQHLAPPPWSIRLDVQLIVSTTLDVIGKPMSTRKAPAARRRDRDVL